MNANQNLQPDTAIDIQAAIDGYAPRLMPMPLADRWLGEIKDLVRRCEPVDVNDATHMLTTASRYFTDTEPGNGQSLSEALSDARVGQWLRTALRNGMPTQTLSNHRQRLARFQRVLRGLPARMSARGRARLPHEPLGHDERVRLEHPLLRHPEALAAYVAAVGANLIASEAVGSVIHVDGNEATVGENRVVADIALLAALVNGHTIGEHAWSQVRRVADKHHIDFDKTVARATFTLLATDPAAPLSSLVALHQLTRRMLDDVAEQLPRSTPERVAAMLRA